MRLLENSATVVCTTMRTSQVFFSLYTVFRNMPSYFYAVAKGRNPGIYSTWEECKAQVYHYSGPVYKKFSTKSEAENFIQERTNFAPPVGKTQALKALLGSKRKTFTSTRNYSSSPPPKGRKVILIDENISSERKEKPGSFSTDENGFVVVYTDGACSSNGGSNPRAGIGVWFGDNHPLNVSRSLEGRATNNHAEIQAVTTAAKQAKNAGIKKLMIKTDSKFLIQCATEWLPKWKKNGWKTINNKTVRNKEELIEMDEALSSLNISFNHVNGHAGIYGNEMADKLARNGCSL